MPSSWRLASGRARRINAGGGKAFLCGVALRSLVRLKALQAFEASARHGSFHGAATELQVTAAAVGQLVRSLETWLGAPVFERRGSGRQRLVPMPDAQAAIHDLTEGLNRVDAGLGKLKQRRGREAVTVTASQALVAKWLLPRLDDFSRLHRRIDVRLDVTDRLVDLARGEADVAVRCGPGGWQGIKVTRLGGEEVFPVCSPALLDDCSEPSSDWLLGQSLIHDLLAPPGIFPSWDDWLNRVGWNAPSAARGLRVNASATAIDAAACGQGVALVRAALVHRDLANGRLVRLFPQVSWPVEWAYYALASSHALKRDAVARFEAWLIASWDAV